VSKVFRKYSLPGLKRWFFIVILGLATLIFGLALVFKAHPVTRIAQFTWNTLSFIADNVPPTISGIITISLGIFLLIYSFFKANKQILTLVAPDESSLLETLDRALMENKGIKIVAIGGGTGLSNMLKGLKNYTSNITAVVTVADDGGSSGRLRKTMDIVPPGDIRNCIAALSHDDEVITQLFQYRFDKESPEDLQNHSFGNLFLTALVELGGSRNMADAVKHACRILKARGNVLPVSNTPMQLIAEMEDGRKILGESKIPEANGRITKLSCEEPVPEVLPEVIDSIKDSEIIILGPGSLYTSIIPNLLVPDLVRAIAQSAAIKIYVCNVMTQPGETTNYSVSDHVQALKDHTQNIVEDFSSLVDYVVVNDSSPHKKQLEKYKADNQYPVELDFGLIKELGLKVYPTNLLQKGDFVRHNPYKLSKAILEIYSKQLKRKNRAVRKLLKAS
jgi:uncharacterized cofD-like protein